MLLHVKASLSKQYQVASYADTNTFGTFTIFIKLCSSFISEAFIGTEIKSYGLAIIPWLCVVLASVFTGGVPSDVGSVGGLGSDGQTTANIITAGGGVLVTSGLVKQ